MYKKLPHVTQTNAIQFVTFRTQASVASYLRQNNIKSTSNTAKAQFHLDQYLDNCDAGALFYGDLITALIHFFKSKDNVEYELIAVSVMPNHIHLMFKQLQILSSIMHHIKGGTGHLVNKYLNQSGWLWDKGYFDKVIRSEKQFQVTYDYIRNNAYKANLNDASKRFYGVYDEEN